MTSITIRVPDDFHVHLREGELLKAVIHSTATNFRRALVMPNLSTPITTPGYLRNYRDRIIDLSTRRDFTPLMTFYLNEKVKPEDVAGLREAGAFAGKYYPKGLTTNSDSGASGLLPLYPVIAEMEKEDLVLCLHGETGLDVLEREHKFLQDEFEPLCRNFPKLRVVLEHITTEAAMKHVLYAPDNVAATITAHHLLVTIDDIIGDKLRPHLFCKPIPKTRADREALIRAAMSGNPKFFFGSDSAPHVRETKECASGCAGVFTAPFAVNKLLDVFEERGALHMLEAFTSEHGATFYNLDLNKEYVTYRRGGSTPVGWLHVYSNPGSEIVVFDEGTTTFWRK